MPETNSPADEQPQPGLRERKKALTHRTIADAAFTLTVEHGLEHVTIDQIADLAFVSPRTVSNYFMSKEAAVVAAKCEECGRGADGGTVPRSQEHVCGCSLRRLRDDELAVHDALHGQECHLAIIREHSGCGRWLRRRLRSVPRVLWKPARL